MITPEEAIAIPAIRVPPKSARPLRNWASLIILLIIANATRNVVHPTRKNPFRLEINATPVLSNNTVTERNTIAKIIEVHMMNLLSFLRNGNARKKSPIGNMKNCIHPHEARPNASKIPLTTIFARETFPLSDFKALRRR